MNFLLKNLRNLYSSEREGEKWLYCQERGEEFEEKTIGL